MDRTSPSLRAKVVNVCTNRRAEARAFPRRRLDFQSLAGRYFLRHRAEGEGRNLKNRHRERAIGRREALRRVVAGAGASAALPALGAAAAKPAATMPHASMPEAPALGSAEPPDPSLSAADWKPKFFDEHQNKTVIVLSDLIIPETDTPGAKRSEEHTSELQSRLHLVCRLL